MSTGGPISDGEASHMRERMRLMELRAEAAHARHDVHEAVCSARYRNIILLILGLTAANSVAGFPHLVQILAFLK